MRIDSAHMNTAPTSTVSSPISTEPVGSMLKAVHVYTRTRSPIRQPDRAARCGNAQKLSFRSNQQSRPMRTFAGSVRVIPISSHVSGVEAHSDRLYCKPTFARMLPTTRSAAKHSRATSSAARW